MTLPRTLRIVVAVIGPVLLAAYPLLSLFAQNLGDLELSVLVWPVVICLSATVVLVGLLLLITRP